MRQSHFQRSCAEKGSLDSTPLEPSPHASPGIRSATFATDLKVWELLLQSRVHLFHENEAFLLNS